MINIRFFRYPKFRDGPRGLLQYPYYIYYKFDDYDNIFDYYEQDTVLISVNMVEGTKTTLKVKPPETLEFASIIGGKILFSVGDAGTFFTSLRTGEVLAEVDEILEPVNHRSLGDEEDDHLCYARYGKIVFELRSGIVLLYLSHISRKGVYK